MKKFRSTCIDCGCEFEITEREIEDYKKKTWNRLKRCKSCRKNKNDNPYNQSPGIKTSSFFENSQIYGSMMPVEGGICSQIEYTIKMMNHDNKYYLKYDDPHNADTYRLVTDESRANSTADYELTQSIIRNLSDLEGQYTIDIVSKTVHRNSSDIKRMPYD